MNTPFQVWNNSSALRAVTTLVFMSVACSCSSLKQVSQTPALPTVNPAERSLLEMNFEDAKSISPHTAQVGSLFRVAADSVEVLKTDSQGQPVKVRAKGHVFIEMSLAQRTTALCEEAIMTRDEVSLTGKPMVKRGNRVARATEQGACFWVSETRLHTAGKCELAQVDESVPQPMMLASNTGGDFFPVPEPILPPANASWVASTDNVLLPALPEPADTVAAATLNP